MNMNRYIYTLMAAVALLLGITACNEKLSMFEANQNPPEVTDFSPKNGVAGTEISITGANPARGRLHQDRWSEDGREVSD